MSKSLTAAERRDLKSRAHALHPLVMIGNDGLSPAVVKAIDEALKSHELIKIRAAGEGREGRDALLAAICEHTGASPVQHIGKMLVVWRKRPAEEPPAPAAKPARPARPTAPRVRATARTTLRPARPLKPAVGPDGDTGPARPGRAPRLLPRRARPTRSGRR